MKLSPHFDASEFRCRCGNEACSATRVPIDPRLLEALEVMRETVGPLRVTSGLRCEPHNRHVGGHPSSEHLVGMAADLAADTAQRRWALVEAAMKAGVHRIGVDDRFVHVGTSTTLPPRVLWLYGASRMAA